MGKLTMTRRTFAKMAAATAAAVGIAGTGTALAESSASTTSTSEVKRIRSTCRGCGKMECGVWVYVQDGKVIRSEGDEAAFQSMGNHCSKGQASLRAAYHPDRLKYPMKRTNPKCNPSWATPPASTRPSSRASRTATARPTTRSGPSTTPRIGDAPFGRCQIGVELSLRPTKAAMPPADPSPAAWRPLKTSSLPQAAPSAWRHPIPLTPLQTGMSPSERGRFASQSAQRAYVWVALCFGFAFVGVLT